MRLPAVAGMFYPSSAGELRAEVDGFLAKARIKVEAKKRLAIVCPHAGYVYSGATAAYSFASCSNWEERGLTAVVIGPNHTGMGAPIAISQQGWKTPLGEVECDVGLAEAIIGAGRIARKDEIAHLQEHSCEVQLPFLQLVAPSARVVCICMGWQDEKSAQDLGRAIFDAAKKAKRNIIAIASSDFTHYESAQSAKEKDSQAIALLEKMDMEGFEGLVDAQRLSICGHGPIACALAYAKLAGARNCELLRYTNSGEATGDAREVVAYASLAISK